MPDTAPVAVRKVTMPDGTSVEVENESLGDRLQQFLASNEPAPRTFTFERLNFATASAELPADAQATVATLAQILNAYPGAKVRLLGYADQRGTEPANVQLGRQRAEAVAKALIQRGMAEARITTASGGEQNPVDTNATREGRAQNRRTDLVVLAK